MPAGKMDDRYHLSGKDLTVLLSIRDTSRVDYGTVNQVINLKVKGK